MTELGALGFSVLLPGMLIILMFAVPLEFGAGRPLLPRSDQACDRA